MKIKLAEATPVFRSGKIEPLTNYRPMSVLPWFSNILERIMYNIDLSKEFDTINHKFF